MNRKVIKRILATSVSIMILSTMVTISGNTNLKVYAIENSTNSDAIKGGGDEITGTLKSIGNINYDYDNDGKKEEYLVITLTQKDNSGVSDRSFFINKNRDVSKEVENAIIGQPITVSYAFGTPIKNENELIFPLVCVIKYKLDENSKTAIVDRQYAVYGDIEIPEEVEMRGEKYSVTSIGRYAFAGCTNLTSIDIPNSVKNIDDKAFYVCSSLKSIKVPNNVTNIGYEAFYGCNSLISVTIPSSLSFIGSNIVDRFNYVNTFIMDENNQNFKTDDGVLFYREKAASALEICGLDFEIKNGFESVGYWVSSGTLKSKKYIDYDYNEDGNSEEYEIITISMYNGTYDSLGFVKKDSDISKELDKAIIGQHIEMGRVTTRPIDDAFEIASIKLAPTSTAAGTTVGTTTAGTTTVGTTTVGTTTATGTTVATNTVATNTVATNTVATNTVATNTPTATSTDSTTTVQEEKQQKQSDINSETTKSGELTVLPIVSTFILGSVAMFGARRKRN